MLWRVYTLQMMELDKMATNIEVNAPDPQEFLHLEYRGATDINDAVENGNLYHVDVEYTSIPGVSDYSAQSIRATKFVAATAQIITLRLPYAPLDIPNDHHIRYAVQYTYIPEIGKHRIAVLQQYESNSWDSSTALQPARISILDSVNGIDFYVFAERDIMLNRRSAYNVTSFSDATYIWRYAPSSETKFAYVLKLATDEFLEIPKVVSSEMQYVGFSTTNVPGAVTQSVAVNVVNGSWVYNTSFSTDYGQTWSPVIASANGFTPRIYMFGRWWLDYSHYNELGYRFYYYNGASPTVFTSVDNINGYPVGSGGRFFVAGNKLWAVTSQNHVFSTTNGVTWTYTPNSTSIFPSIATSGIYIINDVYTGATYLCASNLVAYDTRVGKINAAGAVTGLTAYNENYYIRGIDSDGSLTGFTYNDPYYQHRITSFGAAPIPYTQTKTAVSTPARCEYIVPDSEGAAYVLVASDVYAQLYKTNDGITFEPFGTSVTGAEAGIAARVMPYTWNYPAMRLYSTVDAQNMVCFAYGTYLFYSYNDGATWQKESLGLPAVLKQVSWALSANGIGYLACEAVNYARVNYCIRMTVGNTVNIQLFTGDNSGATLTGQIQQTTSAHEAEILIADDGVYIVDVNSIYENFFSVYKVNVVANSYELISNAPYSDRRSPKYIASGKLRVLVVPGTTTEYRLQEYEYAAATNTWTFLREYETSFPVRTNSWSAYRYTSNIAAREVDGQLWLLTQREWRTRLDLHVADDSKFIFASELYSGTFHEYNTPVSSGTNVIDNNTSEEPMLAQWGNTVIARSSPLLSSGYKTINGRAPAAAINVTYSPEWEVYALNDQPYDLVAVDNTVIGAGWWNNDGQIFTSHDGGKTWAYTPIINGSLYNIISLGNGVFVGCGEQNVNDVWRPISAKTIDNGDTWTFSFILPDNDYYWPATIAYNGSVFVVADFRNQQVYISSDAEIWTTVILDPEVVVAEIGYVVSVGERFVLYPWYFNVETSTQHWYSDDNGATWVAVAGSTFKQCVATVIDDVIYVYDEWENKVWRSTDGGITHTVVVDLADFSDAYYGPSFLKFIAKCGQGYFMFDADSYNMLVSSDGITWTRDNSSPRVYPADTGICIGIGNNVLRSTGGIDLEYGPNRKLPFWTDLINCEDV